MLSQHYPSVLSFFGRKRVTKQVRIPLPSPLYNFLPPPFQHEQVHPCACVRVTRGSPPPLTCVVSTKKNQPHNTPEHSVHTGLCAGGGDLYITQTHIKHIYLERAVVGAALVLG